MRNREAKTGAMPIRTRRRDTTNTSVREANIEGLILNEHPGLRRSVYESLEEVRKTGGTALAEVKRRLKIHS